MSVILTGMDMPETCHFCPLQYDTISCSAMNKMLDYSNMCYERLPDCPLKSVDGLIEKIERMGGNEEKSVYKNLHPSYVQGLKDTIRIIKEYCEMEENNADRD